MNPFVMPTRRNLAVVLFTARAFIESAATRQAEFEKFGLPATFIADFKVQVDQLQQAADVRLNAETARSKAQAGIAIALADGLDAVRDLDVIVAIATRQTAPATFAAWTAARRIEGQGAGATKNSLAPPVPVPPVLSVGELEKAS